MDPDLDDTLIGAVRPESPTYPPLDPDGRGARALREEAERGAAPPPPAPVYYFRVGADGERLPLDRSVYIGRRPTLPRIAPNEPIRRVTVDSPNSEVSSTHIELRQNGVSVVATDLRSTNGSIIVIPGSTPRKLRPGESIVITPGTLIDIGDGNRVEILSPRVVASPAQPPPTNSIGITS